jgi:hypothetical protein
LTPLGVASLVRLSPGADTIDFPGALTTLVTGINDRGQIVGAYENPNAAPDAQPGPMRMPMMMSGSDG